jgi:hypothetical protein
MKRARRALGLWTVYVAAVVVACNGGEDIDPPPGDGKAACEELGAICHDDDDGDGPIAKCHDIGHRGIPEACLAEYDECMRVCTAGGEGGEGHGGAGGESQDGAGGESHHGNTE